jgi:hypothetical protein
MAVPAPGAAELVVHGTVGDTRPLGHGGLAHLYEVAILDGGPVARHVRHRDVAVARGRVRRGIGSGRGGRSPAVGAWPPHPCSAARDHARSPSAKSVPLALVHSASRLQASVIPLLPVVTISSDRHRTAGVNRVLVVSVRAGRATWLVLRVSCGVRRFRPVPPQQARCWCEHGHAGPNHRSVPR